MQLAPEPRGVAKGALEGNHRRVPVHQHVVEILIEDCKHLVLPGRILLPAAEDVADR